MLERGSAPTSFDLRSKCLLCRAQAQAAAEVVQHAGRKVDLMQGQQRSPAPHLSALQHQELLRRLDSLSLHAAVHVTANASLRPFLLSL